MGDQPPAQRLRANSILVLCAWTAFVLAGASFQRLSEHFAPAMPARARGLAQVAFSSVVGLGVSGAVLVVVGSCAAMPALASFLRGGGWGQVRRPVATAGALSVLVVGSLIALSHWAHGLSPVQRNGGDTRYSIAFVLWSLLVAAALVAWTTVGVRAARRIALSRRVLRVETSLAVALASVMVLVTGATALWWELVARSAPWFLQGATSGVAASPFNPQLVVTMTTMALAASVATLAAGRVTRSWRAVCDSPDVETARTTGLGETLV